MLGYLNLHEQRQIILTSLHLLLKSTWLMNKNQFLEQISHITNCEGNADVKHLFALHTGFLSRVCAANVIRTPAPMTAVAPTTRICPLT